jgi:transposase InsO family protein
MAGNPRPSRQPQTGAAPDAAVGTGGDLPAPEYEQPGSAHKIYPYLLRGLVIERVNQVWCSDITYIPMAKGFLYLVVISVLMLSAQKRSAGIGNGLRLADPLLTSRPV